jgi:ADP-heptose:LPS heptosyltransferase
LPSRIQAERILVILFRQIGDVLLTTPLVRALRQHYPQSHITFLTEPSAARVLQDNPFLDDILIRSPHSSWYQELQLLRRIRRLRFNLVVDVMGNSRSTIVSWISGARQRVAFDHFPRSLFYTMRVDGRPDMQEYTVCKRLRLLEPLGIQCTDLSLDFRYTQKDQDEVDRFLLHHQITSDDLLICIDPTNHIPTRQWPGEHFSQLADRLSAQCGARVVLLWGPGEREQVQAIAAASCSQPVLIPEWELAPLAALLARANLFIGCDSAPLHIAVSQRTPTLSLHGSTSAIGWIPPEPQHRGVMLGLPCQPCGQAQCDPLLDIACLRTLSVDTVFAAVQACRPWVPKWRHASNRLHVQGRDTTE